MDSRRASRERVISTETMEAQLKRRAASGAGNTSGGSDLHQIQTGRRLLPIMMAEQPDARPQARRDNAAPPLTIPAPALDRHWYVPGAGGYYCAACNLPRRNGRHVERVA